MIWNEQYDVPGIGYQTELNGRKLFIQPDMDRQRWYWIVVWAGNKEKFDKKKGVMVKARPQVKAWGTSPSLSQAKEDAVERAMKPRPRAPGEAEEERDTLSL